MALWTTILAFYFGGRQFRRSKEIKQRDSSWPIRHALGHKVESNPKAYTHKRKHPKEDDPEEMEYMHQLEMEALKLRLITPIKWLLKSLKGKPVPKYLAGKKADP